MLIIKRQAGNVTLHVRGRDIEEAEKAIQFSREAIRIGNCTDSDQAHRSVHP
jgi:hypothetical protein